MIEQLVTLIQNYPWFAVVTAAVSLASAIASITPTPAPGTKLAKVYAVIDFIALNIGKAKDTGVKK
jgi:hypothetical protein